MKKLLQNAVNILLLLLTSVLCLLGTEAIFRVIDGYRLANLKLVTSREPDSAADYRQAQAMFDRARGYAAAIKINPDFRLEWYDSKPPLQKDHSATFPLPADWAQAVEKATGRQKRELRYWYNYNFAKSTCQANSSYDELAEFKAHPGFVYTFTGPDDTAYPQIRYVPHGWDELNGSYNNFGFRGPDLAHPKPSGTIRIAFLGQSTTENGWPWTYPELVVQMLREWARGNQFNVDFDVVNAGRAGVGSEGVARIMRYEVTPLEPDIVLFYSGAANLRAKDVLASSDARMSPPNPQSGIWFLTRYSAATIRFKELVTKTQGAGSEPAKPQHVLAFDLSQQVDPERVDLPFLLHQEIADIRDIAQASRSIEADLFLTSSVVLVHEGLRLDVERNQDLFEQLNSEYWPLSYAEIRLGVEFENRAYRALSEKDQLGFIEIDIHFPKDPDLFADMVHFNDQSGFRLQAWIVAQQLAPFIRDKLQKHELPRRTNADGGDISWIRQTPKKFDLSCLH